MPERYATIIKQDDGTEIVSSIAQMEGVPPEVRADQKDKIKVIKAPDGLKIGMIKGGKGDAVAGFGWPANSLNRPADLSEKEAGTSDPDDKVRADVSGKK